VSEEDPTAMANLDGTVLRRSANDVRAEVAAADEAQREAAKQARKQLRDAHHKKQKAEIDAKLANLRAKLGRPAKPAANS
jgi:flagellar hook-basal body complex protein FliE